MIGFAFVGEHIKAQNGIFQDQNGIFQGDFMSLIDVCLIIERMKQSVKATTDKELGEKAGFPKKNVSNWRVRNSIPFELLVEFAQTHNLSVDWLVFGTEKAQLDTAQQMALLAFNALNDQQKLQAIAFMSGLPNGTTSSVNMTANGNGNNQQVFSGDTLQVNGFVK